MNSSSSQAGFITLDFMFAIVMAMGFAMVLFAISFTLAMVEVGQYVTFAASRAYNGAHATETLQKQVAEAKFYELLKQPALSKVLSSGWVSFTNPVFGNFSEEYADDGNDVFVGAQVRFEARVLNFQVPMLGSTASNTSTGKATLNSYLLREPSTQECRESFNKERYKRLLELDDSYRQTPGQHSSVTVTDNAC